MAAMAPCFFFRFQSSMLMFHAYVQCILSQFQPEISYYFIDFIMFCANICFNQKFQPEQYKISYYFIPSSFRLNPSSVTAFQPRFSNARWLCPKTRATVHQGSGSKRGFPIEGDRHPTIDTDLDTHFLRIPMAGCMTINHIPCFDRGTYSDIWSNHSSYIILIYTDMILMQWHICTMTL